ncbi:hypothetical protein H0H92_005199 [Tricholoma furcatifolium]|nr:hypothetical protein H0H92_005199 [Tricholoma furcatifolium]
MSMGNGNGTHVEELGRLSGSSSQQQGLDKNSALSGGSVSAKSIQGNPNQPQSQPQQPQPQAAPLALHPEIRSVVQLTSSHARKVYFSGPLVRRLERRSADGQHHDEVWFDVWAQLGGTTLSIWDMAQVQEASRQGKEVPPTYVNTTDAFVQVLGSVTTPQTSTSLAKKYSNVLALNTAGSNVLLFSCPDPHSLKAWASSLRLAAWEKSRLEEIYTAHLIRIMLKQADLLSTLVRGRLEGWVRIRIAGQTDWKRLWMIISAGSESVHSERSAPGVGGIGGVPTPNQSLPRKKRISNIFSRENAPALPPKPIVSLYASQRPKDLKKPLLTFKDVSQAFAVYPERPELISRSTLIKLEGKFGEEELAAGMKAREGWMLVMPELEPSMGQAEGMMKWIVAFHDAFEMYGRPEAWTWDPRDPVSLMFAYPVGPNKNLLFLDRETAELLEPRDESTSSIRSRLIGFLLDRMRGVEPRIPAAPSPPSVADNALPSSTTAAQPASSTAASNGFQLPPLSFGNSTIPEEEKPLSPVRRQTNDDSKTTYFSSQQTSSSQTRPIGQATSSMTHETNIFNRPLTTSPAPASPPPQSVSGAEPSVRSPSAQNSVIGAGSGRRSTDTPSVDRAFSVSRVDSVGSSASAARSESRPPTAAGNTAPSISQLLSSGEGSINSSAAPLHSPPSYAVSSASVSPPPPASDPSTNAAFKRTVSVLTSPHSALGHDDEPNSSPVLQDHISILTSPHSISDAPPILTSPYSPRGTIRSLDGRNSIDRSSLSGPPITNTKSEDSGNLLSEAGALYYMQQTADSSGRRVPTTIDEQADSEAEDDSSSHHVSSSQHSARLGAVSPASNDSTHSRNQPVRQSTPMAFFERSSPILNQSVPAISSADHLSPSRQVLGRKPSGARAQPTAHPYHLADNLLSEQVVEDEEAPSEDHYETPVQEKMNQLQAQPSASSEADLDALAALSYLAVDDKPASPPQATVEPLHIQKTPSPPPIVAEPSSQFRSSFAPSKQATERKAKAQAQQAAHQIAAQRPGRANGTGKRMSKVAGAWNESSEEEEEDDEEEDDDDADSDAEPSLANKQNPASTSSSTSLQQRQQLPGEQIGEQPQQYSHLRPPRSLPQVPGHNLHEEYNPPPRRMVPDQYSAAGGPPPRMLQDGTQIRTQADFPQPGAARQTVWSQVLDPGRTANVTTEAPRNNDTFVQLEPSETMTKAFTPQGLLSAGMQDKQDRSAKRQEELARETGASLINVPNKPPPPQMGLLGAITAHERERKREGGVGAALTEREREKRMAEDRQRRFDEHQRQQLDQMQQGGSMYGGQFPAYGMNPMMMMNPMMGMNPMMTGGGMNPMMTGGMAPMMTGQMGFPGMMPGFNPQQFFAAQQAAQAYQQAMMAFSVAGSQVGGDAAGGAAPLNPNMTGGGMAGNMSMTGNMGMGGPMMGFDPRMSMMGMPMMGQMAPMGMQMTGMSTFDPRFSPDTNVNDPGLVPPGLGAGQAPASQNSSQAHGISHQNDSGGPSPRAESPKN